MSDPLATVSIVPTSKETKVLYGWKDQEAATTDEAPREKVVIVGEGIYDYDVVDYADYADDEWGFAAVLPRTDNWRDDK
jgi:hypothetical protein